MTRGESRSIQSIPRTAKRFSGSTEREGKELPLKTHIHGHAFSKLQLTDILCCGFWQAGVYCQISQVKRVAEQVVMIHDVLFYSNNTDSSSDKLPVRWRSETPLWLTARCCVPLLPEHSACESERLIYCSGTFHFFHRQTTDFNNAVCTGTGWFINESNKFPNSLHFKHVQYQLL